MNRLKAILLASALSISVAMPAFANEAQPAVAPIEQFSAADTSLIFEADAQPMQLAVLSQQEMKETEGARIINFGAIFSRVGAATGPAGAWLRYGNSYSQVGEFKTVSISWGSNANYRAQIGNDALRNFNANFRDSRIPINSWRTNDSGHLHLWRR